MDKCFYPTYNERVENMNQKISNPYIIILLSFIGVIVMGAITLILPISNQSGEWGDFVNAMFTSSSAIAVTGLSVYDLSVQFTIFGQFIIIILMMLGGLGIITIFSFFTVVLGKKIGIMERYILKEALNLNSMSGVIIFIKRVVLISSLFIGFGTIMFSLVFVPEFGFLSGLFHSLFHAVSSFNNAGFDILGNSLINYQGNLIIELTTIFLIISGGLGFLIWIELFKQRFNLKKITTYAKVVLTMTPILIIIGTVLLLATELNGTLGLSLDMALFTSVSSRTAGLTVISIRDLTNASKFVIIILMFIGANPISTGGGIKTTTTFIVVLSIYAMFSGKRVHAFKRTFPLVSILKALALVVISMSFILTSVVLVEYIEQFNLTYPSGVKTSTALLFEVVSAFGTVGFSEGITPYLSVPSKLIFSLIMLLGRIGPIAMISVFSDKISWTEGGNFEYMEATVPVG
jgi:trk system potassium uptake protein TrkH